LHQASIRNASFFIPRGHRRSTRKRAPSSLLNNALAAIKSFNAAGLEQTLNRASTELSRPVFLRQTVAPLIEQIGIYWQSGQIKAIQLQDLPAFCAALFFRCLGFTRPL
jgi:hypothetical protein